MEIRWTSTPRSNSQNRTMTALNSISPMETSVPLYISANPSHVQPQQLRRLFALCNHSCHRFPKLIQRNSEYGEAAAAAAAALASIPQVTPQLRGMGIRKMILQKMTRILTSRGIYDIGALCSANERMFFRACGFGDDILGSTTTMYTRTVSACDDGGGGDCQDQMAKLVGRKLLLIPPLKESPPLKVTVGESAED
ncbi:unnamed protein product [Linum tenue]|uniref:Glucosamine-phosphate N-acetyltransferase n=1 Tax=Linum tenue TaxID=586396 RepID=A0AAV0NLA8_9ROSI|nr:unnamed protein product [Linum tenue]